jgi:DNA-directed RNA polymerase subunit RPC12/RpoP
MSNFRMYFNELSVHLLYGEWDTLRPSRLQQNSQVINCELCSIKKFLKAKYSGFKWICVLFLLFVCINILNSGAIMDVIA